MAGNVVFISYAHEPGEHRDRVLKLARALLCAGWDVRLDRYAGAPVKNWATWMAKQVYEADVVLCICTAVYRSRFEGAQLKDSEEVRRRRRRSGLGVSWEGSHLTNRLVLAGGRDDGMWAVLAGGAPDVPVVMAAVAKVSFDVEEIVAALGGPKGEPVREPELGEGYDATLAADPTGLLTALFRPIEPVDGMAPLDVAPSTFLRPEHAVVPFHGREAELAELDAWCASAADVSVKLIHGPGGAGKTRLALELCARRAREGWRSGPLHRDSVDRAQANALCADPIPALVVVDYAEGRPEHVAVLVEEALNGVNGTVRILLLARHASEWVDRLRERVPRLREVEARPMRLEEGEPGSVAFAADAFRKRLGLPLPVRLPPGRGTALDRHVEAFLAVVKAEGEGIVGLVDHERVYLRRVAEARKVEAPIIECLPGAVALATLAQGIPDSDVESWIAHVRGLGDLRQATLMHVGRVLRDVYPGDGGGVGPVRPDRVGEVYVVRHPDVVSTSITAARLGRERYVADLLERYHGGAIELGIHNVSNDILATLNNTLKHETVSVEYVRLMRLVRMIAESACFGALEAGSEVEGQLNRLATFLIDCIMEGRRRIVWKIVSKIWNLVNNDANIRSVRYEFYDTLESSLVVDGADARMIAWASSDAACLLMPIIDLLPDSLVVTINNVCKIHMEYSKISGYSPDNDVVVLMSSLPSQRESASASE